MAQFEIQDDPTMLVERGAYPSPVARLALLAEITDLYLPGEGTKMLAHLGLKPKEIAAKHPEARDLAFVEEVAKAVVQPLPDKLGKLEVLLSFRKEEFAAKGEVETRSAALLNGTSGDADRHVRKARLIAASSARAWSEIMQMADPGERQTGIENLARTLQDILACAPPDKRAAPARAATEQNPGTQLAQTLDDILESEVTEPPDDRE
jgi:hypothetical protein